MVFDYKQQCHQDGREHLFFHKIFIWPLMSVQIRKSTLMQTLDFSSLPNFLTQVSFDVFCSASVSVAEARLKSHVHAQSTVVVKVQQGSGLRSPPAAWDAIYGSGQCTPARTRGAAIAWRARRALVAIAVVSVAIGTDVALVAQLTFLAVIVSVTRLTRLAWLARLARLASA